MTKLQFQYISKEKVLLNNLFYPITISFPARRSCAFFKPSLWMLMGEYLDAIKMIW